MTFKYLLLPVCVLDYVPANYRRCVFVAIKQNYCVQYPPKYAKVFPHSKTVVQKCLFYMRPQKEPFKFLRRLFNWMITG